MSHGRFISGAGILAALILAGCAASWIRVGIRFDRPCRLFPRQEWVLLQTQPDAFAARLLDRGGGNRQVIDLYRFERGDLVHFHLNETVVPGACVGAGEEIARLDSYRNRQAFDELRPQLAEAQAQLRAARTGQRAEVIDLARSEIASASASRDFHSCAHQRNATLYAQGLASPAAHESTQALLRQAEAKLDAARHRLRAAEVGEKEEVVAACQARCDWLIQRVSDAGGRLEGDRIRCPIAGEVVGARPVLLLGCRGRSQSGPPAGGRRPGRGHVPWGEGQPAGLAVGPDSACIGSQSGGLR